MTLLNERDGGINGVPLVWEECETVYDVARGVECYERLKAKGPTGAAAFPLANTPLTYALMERATQDRSPCSPRVLGARTPQMGGCFRMSSPPRCTWWSQNTAKLRFLGQRAGGMAQLQGRKIAHVYQDNDVGRETLPILDHQAAQYGFTVQHLAVQPPGLDQKATWLRVKVAQPDWVILRSGGVMTPTALKEAAQVGIPRDKIVGAQRPARSRRWCRPGRRPLASSARPGMAGETLPAHPGDARTSMPGARGRGRRDVGTGPLDPGPAARPAHRGGAAHGHAPLREPAPDGRAGAVGARTPQPHPRPAQGAGGGGPAPAVHPVLPRS